jgi:hypothetical protein
MKDETGKTIDFRTYLERLDHQVTRVAHCHICYAIYADPYKFLCLNGHPMRICSMTEYGLRQAAAIFN